MKAWVNISIYIVSFSIKTATWSYMLAIYNKDDEKIYDKSEYEDILIKQHGEMFLWDYFASFMTKMSIFVFIFEMVNLWNIISSNNLIECL